MRKFNFKALFIALLSIMALYSCSTETEKNPYRLAYEEIDFTKGEQIYIAKCKICHKINGKGMLKIFPPLAQSDFLRDNVLTSLDMVKHGSSKKIKVNGIDYKAYMPEANLSDEDLLEVFNYILNSWDNKLGSITISDVKNSKKN